jgi:hypothetical protein
LLKQEKPIKTKRERERIEAEIPGGKEFDGLGNSEGCESRNEWIIRKD